MAAGRKGNVEVVREMLADYLHGDYEAALPASRRTSKSLPHWMEHFHGPAGVVSEAKRWEEIWSDYRFAPWVEPLRSEF